MHAAVMAATICGVSGTPIVVELFTLGFPGYRIVGLPDAACRESRDRVRAALVSSGFTYPQMGITINLAPTAQRKGGAGLDLAIALGVLAASDQLDVEALDDLAAFGELGLDGAVRPLAGVAPMVAAIGERTVIVPRVNVAEAHLAAAGIVRCADSLRQVVECLKVEEPWPTVDVDVPMEPTRPLPDLADVRGQPVARRALEISAAGGHHLLFVGPPGSGKSMLARRMPGLLPRLDRAASMEVAMVRSAAGLPVTADGLAVPPWRDPHHTTSVVALIGGGSQTLRPGEISMAHCGTLFLDELGEFSQAALEGLREPLEEGVVRVARAEVRATLPAAFLLIAATNPCPCGGGGPGSCECDLAARTRYLRRLSGPLLDRFDLRVAVHRPSVGDLLDGPPGEPSARVRERVVAARALAIERQGAPNATIDAADIDELAPLTSEATELLRGELESGRLSGRGYHRVRRVARTIADLAAHPGPLLARHVAVALSLRVAVSGASPATPSLVGQPFGHAPAGTPRRVAGSIGDWTTGAWR